MTDQIKQQTAEIKGKYDDVIFDLNVKKKFYAFEFEGVGDVIEIRVTDCGNVPEEACAFIIESIQIDGSSEPGIPLEVIVDGVVTDFSGKSVTLPTNLLVDTGVGAIGASESVVLDEVAGEVDSVIITGEKPQGVQLEAFGAS